MRRIGWFLRLLTAVPAALGLLLLVFKLTGIGTYVILSGSMEPAVPTGSVCLVDKNAEYEDLQEGDIIAYQKAEALVAHRVISINGEGIQTKGDANDCSDGISTTRENFVGRVFFHVPGLGYACSLLMTARGRILSVTVLFCLLVLSWYVSDLTKEGEKQ